MSISINVWYINSDGETTKANLGDSGKYLMGSENTRKSFWGHEIMSELELDVLPKLRDIGYLQISSEELDYLEKDVKNIQINLSKILSVVEVNRQFVIQRTNNILNAIEIARKREGWIAFG